MLGTLSRLYRDAVLWGYAESNLTKVAESAPKSFRFWVRQQSDRFLEDVAEHEPALFPILAACTLAGLRAGEACGLDWTEVDLRQRRLRVVKTWTEGHMTTPKHGKTREVPLTSRLVTILAGAPRALRSTVTFPHPNKERFDDGLLWHAVDRAVRRTGLPRLSVHDLRHTYASQLAMAGTPLAVLKEYLGHADIRMTLRYAHLCPAETAGWVEALSEPVHREKD